MNTLAAFVTAFRGYEIEDEHGEWQSVSVEQVEIWVAQLEDLRQKLLARYGEILKRGLH
jgi:hypothetical protein